MVYIGIDLGGTNIAVGAVSEAGSILVSLTMRRSDSLPRSLLGLIVKSMLFPPVSVF